MSDAELDKVMSRVIGVRFTTRCYGAVLAPPCAATHAVAAVDACGPQDDRDAFDQEMAKVFAQAMDPLIATPELRGREGTFAVPDMGQRFRRR